ncbi:Suf-domain-containing protein [Leucogyrophana mollusca]|uniref:Suf-domain-containing protein n=1 Tax=Leucogyrophana mollusca TaxID=85980 RepID=A0ACB8B8G0_9AGAM|nr:Suf-domain-containing protein [Leucogyrophana mollusca]
MSEQPQDSRTDTDSQSDIPQNDGSYNGDKTQPSEDIMHALNSLNPQAFSTVSQNGHEPQPQGEDATQDASQEPPSEWHVLRSKLRDEPHDPDGWNRLVDLAENAGDTEQIKESYEALLETYPNTSSAQIAYLNHFLRPGLFQYAEDLFKKYLKASPLVDLWKFYLSYVRRVNITPNTRDAVIKAYEFALNRIGQDKDSGEIWNDYIQFLKAGETTTTWEESQKMDALRKVYHRAVQIPLENVERLWSELEAFENNLNKITAKKFMSDLSPSYMQARTVLRQLQRHLGPLFPPPPQSSSSRPPLYLPPTPTFNAAERALVGAWKTYLKWEESNPLEFEDKDRSTLISRIQGVYRKAVIRMRYYSEIWYMAFVWTNSVGKQEDAVNILKAGMEANPTSFLLHFAYAEQIEARGDHTEVIATFDKLLDKLRIDLEALEARANSANSSFSSDGSGRTVPVNTPAPTTTGLTEAGTHSNNSSFATQSADEKPPKVKELAERRTEYGLVWIMYIRFARRAQDIKSFRQIFAKARRDRWTPWEVYESAALMEYHCTKESGAGIASRIFEKGLESFGDEIEFVLRYLGFLISVNDDTNARALFERVITTFSSERARPLWERWARYEYQYGDLAAAQKLEKRIAEVYPSDPPIKRFAQRHTYLGTDAIAARDLGFAMAARQPTVLGPSGLSGPLEKRTDSLPSISCNAHMPSSQPTTSKRPSSPDYKRREGSARPSDSGPPTKRARPMSPPPPRDRDRDRWDGPPSRRRFGSPAAWERERERELLPIKRERERDDEKGPSLPGVLSWFVGQLPSPSSFDGPIFRTDDLMMLFRNAVIPSATRRATPPPPPPPPAGPPRGAGRPPPDYGPYQGPGGGRGGRRY